MNYPIYKTTGPASIDELWAVTSVTGNAVTALERFAVDEGLEDYSLDTTREGRLYLCPPQKRPGTMFFYTYLDPVADS